MTNAQIIDSAISQGISLGIICRLLGNPQARISRQNLAEIVGEMRVRCGIYTTQT
jgi:hypothetical protein